MHSNETSQPTSALSRRAMLKNTLLTGAVVGVVSVASAGTARAAAPGAQSEWAFCRECMGLYYGPWGGGVCPNGFGPHVGYQSISYNYRLLHDYGGSSGVQANWQVCDRCSILWYGPNQYTSACPAGGGHTAIASYNYDLYYGRPGANGFQVDWAWCLNCQGLFYLPDEGSSHCPSFYGQGPHDGGASFNYGLFY